MTTHREYSYYANEVYTKGGGRALNGWSLYYQHYPEHQWNLGMAAYINRETKELIIAYRGTEDIWDLLADFGLWNRQVHPAQADAVKVTETIINDVSKEFLVNLSNLYTMSNTVSKALIQALLFSAMHAAVAAGLVAFPGGRAAFLASMTAQGFIGLMETEEIQRELITSLAKDLSSEEKKLGDDLIKNLKLLIKKEHLKSITCVGHSMGGHIAELTASRLRKNSDIPITAVTFDSPGFYDIVNVIEEYKNPNYNFITSYLSAPNIVNTCHHHAGEIRRLYIPHVEDEWTWSHAGLSLSHSAFRGAVYAGATAVLVTNAAATAAATAVLGPATAASIAQGAGAVVSGVTAISMPTLVIRAAAGVIDVTFRDYTWFSRQHSKNNLLACFSEDTGLPIFYSRMSSWPHISRIMDQISARIGRTLSSLYPLPEDAPGMRTIFSENWMRENQVQGISNYKIFESHGKPPSWMPVKKEAKSSSQSAFIPGAGAIVVQEAPVATELSVASLGNINSIVAPFSGKDVNALEDCHMKKTGKNSSRFSRNNVNIIEDYVNTGLNQLIFLQWVLHYCVTPYLLSNQTRQLTDDETYDLIMLEQCLSHSLKKQNALKTRLDKNHEDVQWVAANINNLKCIVSRVLKSNCATPAMLNEIRNKFYRVSEKLEALQMMIESRVNQQNSLVRNSATINICFPQFSQSINNSKMQQQISSVKKNDFLQLKKVNAK